MGNIQGSYYDRLNKVLYVICHNTRELWAFDIDDTSTTTLAATQGQVVATFNFDPHDLHVTPDGAQLVVGGDSGTTAKAALLNIGINASDVTVAVSDTTLTSSGRPLSDYQSFAFDSNGALWAFIKQNGGSGPGYAMELDPSTLTPTGNQITFSGNQLGAGAIAQTAVPADPDVDGDGVPASLDCNDADATVWEESEFWVDADGDLVGDDYTPSGWFCGASEAAASGYTATLGGDCDDANATVYSGATELCDGIANDCDTPSIPADELDDDGDGLAQCAGDCAPIDPTTYPGAPEQCNGVSDDCDLEVDEDLTSIQSSPDMDGDGEGTNDPLAMVESCAVPDGNSTIMTDCADGNATINTAAPEVCGGGDEDCDGQENEGDAQDAVPLWIDEDGDDRGLPGAAELGCEGNPGTATQDGDCDDEDASIYPGAPEYADGRDKDCDTNPSAALNVPITAITDNTLIGNPGIPSENGPNVLKGLGQSVNVKVTQMTREYDEILEETQEVLGYQTVDSSAVGQLRVSREAGGVPIYVYQRPSSAAPDYIPTWTAAVTGTVLEVLDQPSGIVRLSVVEGTSVVIETEFYNDSDLWDAYEEANPEAGGNPLLLSNPGDWAEIDQATGEILDSNVAMIKAFLDFVDEYQQQGDDDSGDDDSGDDDTEDDDDTGDDDTQDDDDATPDDDDTTGDDDSAGEIPDCEGCQAIVLTIGPDGQLTLNPQALAWATLATAATLRRRRRIRKLQHAA